MFNVSVRIVILFFLFEEEDKDLFYNVKNNNIDGFFIIFWYVIVEKMFIRNNFEKFCIKVVGYDVNIFYLWINKEFWVWNNVVYIY